MSYAKQENYWTINTWTEIARVAVGRDSIILYGRDPDHQYHNYYGFVASFETTSRFNAKKKVRYKAYGMGETICSAMSSLILDITCCTQAVDEGVVREIIEPFLSVFVQANISRHGLLEGI